MWLGVDVHVSSNSKQCTTLQGHQLCMLFFFFLQMVQTHNKIHAQAVSGCPAWICYCSSPEVCDMHVSTNIQPSPAVFTSSQHRYCQIYACVITKANNSWFSLCLLLWKLSLFLEEKMQKSNAWATLEHGTSNLIFNKAYSGIKKKR